MRDPSSRVIHEEAADEIVTISDSRRVDRVRASSSRGFGIPLAASTAILARTLDLTPSIVVMSSPEIPFHPA